VKNMSTTIAISNEIREQLKEFGTKGETYNEILARLIKSAKERQLQELLMSTEDCITIDQAIKRAKKKWQ
jgi:predicted CopG family antitoxin